jgi:transcription elongation factor GreA
VVVESDGDEQTYVLVNTAEADPRSGRISDASPVGRAIIGARAGDTVTVSSPAGSSEYIVREVR